MIYTKVLALGSVFAGLGFLLWSYKKLHRITAWLIGAGAFILTVAIVPWRNALAGIVGTPAGLVWLTGLTVASAIAFMFEAVAKHKHHRIRTPVIAATLGVTLVLAIADVSDMLSSLGKSTSGTGTALSTAVRKIHSGAAAKAVPKDHRYLILAAGVSVVVALIVLGIRMDKKRKPEPAATRMLPGRRALPSGGPRTAVAPRGRARR